MAQAQRHVARNEIPMEALEKAVEDLDGERIVVLKEGSQQIRLVPCASLIDPLPWIFEGMEDVVKVDVDARDQPGKDVKNT